MGLKLLFDQNLSHRLLSRLADVFPGSVHVRPLGLDRSPDDRIWQYAKAAGYCIVTQDADFAERSRLYGSPPKVVWLRCGNATPQEVEGILRHHAPLIAEMIQDPTAGYVEVF